MRGEESDLKPLRKQSKSLAQEAVALPAPPTLAFDRPDVIDQEEE
jgi:hypothetical protein